MIKTALFALDQNEADQYIEKFGLDPEEVRFVNSEEDIEDLTDHNTIIVLHGQYYERPQWYTELADKLAERLRNGGAKVVGDGAVPGFADGGAEEAQDAGEPSEADLPAEREDGQQEPSDKSGDDTSAAKRPNLPRRKSDEAAPKS